MAEHRKPSLMDLEVEEKLDSNQVEHAGDSPSSYTPAEQQKLIRRIDRHLIIPTGLMFCCCLMDRNNLGAAAIAGMTVDLKLVQYRYVSGPSPDSRISMQKGITELTCPISSR